jgi:hypothetical protein
VGRVAVTKPDTHESWCPYEYVECEPCTCDLDERRACYEREHREPNAAALPCAVLKTSKAARCRQT